MVGYFTPRVALLRQGAAGGRGINFKKGEQEQQYVEAAEVMIIMMMRMMMMRTTCVMRIDIHYADLQGKQNGLDGVSTSPQRQCFSRQACNIHDGAVLRVSGVALQVTRLDGMLMKEARIFLGMR